MPLLEHRDLQLWYVVVGFFRFRESELTTNSVQTAHST
ncbi:hypothetical protein NMS_1314 [Nonlabens marinus S1-08]|uniref:Uncharacterized protein n=1 Tax=Nonlabens marinus S1-08 TaxID=1454201 RepID=W8VVC5_9FLAO|nr:hypothetical protein NMS_1314 [Nonlabens marinus S1-08]